VLFAPSGDDIRFVGFGASRINAAGWRPHGLFPGGVDLRGAYLRGCELTAPGSNYANLRLTKWDHANLENFSGSQSTYRSISAVEIYAPNAEIHLSAIADANFTGADLKGAGLAGTFIVRCNFSGAILTDANLSAAYLQKVNFSGARLTKASFRVTTSSDLNFEGADRTDADFRQAQTMEDETFAPVF
jgi:uncharacterized protein YjbI with pentapeptide repeats